MLKIRFARWGRKKLPFFRIVLTEHTKAASHGYMKVLGFYNPLTKDFKIDEESTKKYLSNWAQLSASLDKIIKRKNIKL